MMAASKEMPLRRGTWSVTSPEVVVRFSVITTAAVALAGLAALVAGCLGEFFRFGFQQLVERLLYAAADQLLDLPLDYFLVELYNVVGHGLSSPFRMCVATSFYQRPASRVYFFALFNLRNLLYLIQAGFRSLSKTSIVLFICPIIFSPTEIEKLPRHFVGAICI